MIDSCTRVHQLFMKNYSVKKYKETKSFVLLETQLKKSICFITQVLFTWKILWIISFFLKINSEKNSHPPFLLQKFVKFLKNSLCGKKHRTFWREISPCKRGPHPTPPTDKVSVGGLPYHPLTISISFCGLNFKMTCCLISEFQVRK